MTPYRKRNARADLFDAAQSMRVIPFVLTLCLAACATKPQTERDDSGFPVYGNWCGPNHPGPGRFPKPIDEVDAACMRHDLCYAKEGYFSCVCDAKLLSDLTEIHSSKWNGRSTVSANEYKKFEMPVVTAIRAYFVGSPCSGVPNLPVKLIAGGDAAVRTAVRGIDIVYFIVRLPFLLAGKAVCALSGSNSLTCSQIDDQIDSGTGIGSITIQNR
jgi:hypothetical protein